MITQSNVDFNCHIWYSLYDSLYIAHTHVHTHSLSLTTTRIHTRTHTLLTSLLSIYYLLTSYIPTSDSTSTSASTSTSTRTYSTSPCTQIRPSSAASAFSASMNTGKYWALSTMYVHAHTVMHSDHSSHFLSVYCSPLSVSFSSPSISYLYSHSFQFILYYYYNNVRTVLSWKGKSGLSIEYLLGCGEASTPPERYVRMYEHIHTYTHIHRHTHTHT